MLDTPKKPLALEMLEFLQFRKHLTREEEAEYYRLRQGYEGEKQFESVLKELLRKDYKALYSIELEKDKSSFQIDHLLVSGDPPFDRCEKPLR